MDQNRSHWASTLTLTFVCFFYIFEVINLLIRLLEAGWASLLTLFWPGRIMLFGIAYLKLINSFIVCIEVTYCLLHIKINWLVPAYFQCR